MNKIKAIVVSTQTEGRITAKSLLSNENFAISSYVECKPDSFLKINGIYPDIVLCIDENNDLLFELAKRIYVSMPGVVLILVTDNDQRKFCDSSSEEGFHLIINHSVNPEDFYLRVSTINQIEKKRLTEDQRKITNAKVISVYSAKGGTGKTFVATNLSTLISLKKNKCIIIDGSLDFGDVCLFLDIKPKDTIAELAEDSSGVNANSINSYLTLHSTGLNVLPAPKSPELAEYITEEHIEKIISILRPYYDYIIIDLPVSLTNTTLSFIENSDIVLYIGTPEIASLKQMFIVQKIMNSLQQISKFYTVFNKVNKKLIGIGEYKKNVAFPLLSLIHEDKSISKSLESGSPIVITNKKSIIYSDFENIYNKLLNNN